MVIKVDTADLGKSADAAIKTVRTGLSGLFQSISDIVAPNPENTPPATEEQPKEETP